MLRRCCSFLSCVVANVEWFLYPLPNISGMWGSYNSYNSTSTTASSNIAYTGTTASSNSIYYWTQQSQIQQQAAELYDRQRFQHGQSRYQPATPAIIRPEAEAAQRERLRAYQEEQRVRGEERVAANKRAEELMLAHLTPAQREQIKAHGWFIVQGGRSKHNYMIRPTAYAGNIEVTEWDGRRSRLCCHVDHTIPVFDNALAQKLMLEHDEDAFLRIANRTAA